MSNTLLAGDPRKPTLHRAVTLKDIKPAFGSTVRKWRKQLGLSQEQLAGRAGLHRTYVCDVERGSRNVSLDCIQRIAHALEVSMAQLFPADALDAAAENGQKNLDYLLFVGKESNGLAAAVKNLRSGCPSIRIEMTEDPRSGDGIFSNPAGGPQLILLDGDLPGAHQLIERLKSRPRSVPLVIVGGSAHAHEAAARQEAGAAAYLPKPLTMRALKDVAAQFRVTWKL